MGTELTLDQILKIGMIAATLLSLSVNVYLFYKTRSGKALKKVEKDRRDGDHTLHRRVDELREDHTGVDTRLSVLEENVSALPTHEDLRGIERRLSDLKSDLAGNTARTETTLGLVNGINNYLRGIPS